MKARIFSWVIAALCVFGVVKAVQAFKNPWSLPSAVGLPAGGVLGKLPPASAGCGVKCE